MVGHHVSVKLEGVAFFYRREHQVGSIGVTQISESLAEHLFLFGFVRCHKHIKLVSDHCDGDVRQLHLIPVALGWHIVPVILHSLLNDRELLWSTSLQLFETCNGVFAHFFHPEHERIHTVSRLGKINDDADGSNIG
jgi:hypothetical protein